MIHSYCFWMIEMIWTNRLLLCLITQQPKRLSHSLPEISVIFLTLCNICLTFPRELLSLAWISSHKIGFIFISVSSNLLLEVSVSICLSVCLSMRRIIERERERESESIGNRVLQELESGGEKYLKWNKRQSLLVLSITRFGSYAFSFMALEEDMLKWKWKLIKIDENDVNCHIIY